MNLNDPHIRARLTELFPIFCEVVIRSLKKAGDSERPAAASWHVKTKIVKGRAVAVATCKLKTPQGAHSDLTSVTDEEEVGSWDLGEAPGQMRIET